MSATPTGLPSHAAPAPDVVPGTTHTFLATAYVENFPLKELAALFPEGHRTPHEIRLPLAAGGEALFYPFGAVVLRDVTEERRATELEALRGRAPRLLGNPVVRDDFRVQVVPGARAEVLDGSVRIDGLGPERQGVVALTLAQSAAMEYYESLTERLFGRTAELVSRLERLGTVPLGTRPLHRFIGEAIGTRNEVLSVLHLLDKPDAAWDDPVMGLLYGDLRGEFDLGDRFDALEHKMRAIKESLELVLDVARDRRLLLLETVVAALILIELLASLLRL